MCSPHRRALRRLRARAGVRLAVRRDGGLWHVVERLNPGGCQVTRRELADAPTRLGALHLAATRIARTR